MRERTKTYALCATLAAAVVLAMICVWLAVAASAEFRRGELLRDALFSETRLAQGLKMKGVIGTVQEVEGSPEELVRKLRCYLMMLALADLHRDDEGMKASLLLLLGLQKPSGGYGHIPGAEPALRAKLRVMRAALSSEDEDVRWVAALLLLEIGDESDLVALGKAVSDIPGGVFLLASAKGKLAQSDEAGRAVVLKELVGALGSEHMTERVVALQLMSLMVAENGGKEENLFSLFTSEDPAERERAVKHIEEMTGEPLRVDPLEVRRWLEEVKEKSQRQESTDVVIPMVLEEAEED